jgi:hypothetical protein
MIDQQNPPRIDPFVTEYEVYLGLVKAAALTMERSLGTGFEGKRCSGTWRKSGLTRSLSKNRAGSMRWSDPLARDIGLIPMHALIPARISDPEEAVMSSPFVVPVRAFMSWIWTIKYDFVDRGNCEQNGLSTLNTSRNFEHI